MKRRRNISQPSFPIRLDLAVLNRLSTRNNLAEPLALDRGGEFGHISFAAVEERGAK